MLAASTSLVPPGPGSVPRVSPSFFNAASLSSKKATIISESLKNAAYLSAVFTNQIPDGPIVFPSDSQSKKRVVEIKNAIIVELLNQYRSKEAVLDVFPVVRDYIEGSASENFKALVDSYSTLPVESPSSELVQIQSNRDVAIMSLIDSSFSKKIAQDSFIPNFEQISEALDLLPDSKFLAINKQQQSILESIQRDHTTSMAPYSSSRASAAARRVSGALGSLAVDPRDAFTSSQYALYPERPFEALRDDWRDQVTSPRVQRMNISGSGLNCGYYSLAMNIAQFSESQRREIYTKLRLPEDRVDALESCRIRSLNKNSSTSEYQQGLGQILIEAYAHDYGSNISYEHLVAMASHLEISLMVVKSDRQMYENMHLARNIPVDRLDQDLIKCGVTEDDDRVKFVEALRAAGIIGGGAERNLLTITDTQANMIAKLHEKLMDKGYTGDVTAQAMWTYLFQKYGSFITLTNPIAVIYNKYGSASGGHYEAPLHLHQLLFNS